MHEMDLNIGVDDNLVICIETALVIYLDES